MAPTMNGGYEDSPELEREALDGWESRPTRRVESQVRVSRGQERMQRSYQRLIESRRRLS